MAPGVLFVAVPGVEELFANAVGRDGGDVSGGIVGLEDGWGGHLRILYRVFLITFCLDGVMYIVNFLPLLGEKLWISQRFRVSDSIECREELLTCIDYPNRDTEISEKTHHLCRLSLAHKAIVNEYV